MLTVLRTFIASKLGAYVIGGAAAALIVAVLSFWWLWNSRQDALERLALSELQYEFMVESMQRALEAKTMQLAQARADLAQVEETNARRDNDRSQLDSDLMELNDVPSNECPLDPAFERVLDQLRKLDG